MRAPARSVALFLLVAAVAWAQIPPGTGPTRVWCGPAGVGCGPAIVTPTTTTTTTTSTTTTVVTTTTSGTSTTLAGASPSWVPSTLAAWMLDEPTGTRVNAQGTTSRDMVVNAGNPTNSTDRMEGADSLNFPIGAMALATSDTFPTLLSPLSVGCWIKAGDFSGGDGGGAFVMHHYDIGGTPGTWHLRRFPVSGYSFDVKNADGTRSTLNTPTSWPGNTTWHHVVATYVSGGAGTIYVDGTQAATMTMGTGTTTANILYLGNNFNFFGLLDECFLIGMQLSATSTCRICSCGIRGEQCACSGAAFAATGRNATACGSCTLPANCSAAAPS